MDLPVNYNTLKPHEKRPIREEYIRVQNGKCVHCGEDLNGPPATIIEDTKVNQALFPPNFFKWPVHLHHDHNTGMTIGVVHAKCNAVLWQYYGE